MISLTVAAVSAPQGAAQENSLSLEAVYALLRERSPRLAAAQAVADAANAQIPGARLPADPQIQIGAMNFSLPGLNADMPSSMVPSIQAMQMLPFPGKLRLAGDIAAKSRDAALAQKSETWWELRAQAAMQFYELYSADRQLIVMRETLQLLRNYQQVAKAMYGAGEGRQADVLRASVEVARMEADLKRMTAMRAVAAAKLNALLNRPADTPMPVTNIPRLPLSTPATDTLRAWAESTRPMLERGRVLVEQAQQRVALARKEIWPDFTLGLQYGQRKATAGSSMPGNRAMGSIMLGLRCRLAGKRQLKMREEATAMANMARADLTDMRAQVDARIGELLAELDRARSLIELYRHDVLPQAAATVQSAFSSYRVGNVDFMTLVDAQMTENQYKQQLHVLVAEYGAAIAELEMTIGRELPAGERLQAEVL
jgi:outer membrane protein TolC